MKRVCNRCGVERGIVEFALGNTTCRICKTCRRIAAAEWNKKNRESIRELKRRIPDDDPEDDLVPMEAGGFVRWAVISRERRRALGEQSPFNGLSVMRERGKQ